jgi:hypothetical protein
MTTALTRVTRREASGPARELGAAEPVEGHGWYEGVSPPLEMKRTVARAERSGRTHSSLSSRTPDAAP